MFKKYSLIFLYCSLVTAQPLFKENLREVISGFSVGFVTGTIPIAGTVVLPYVVLGRWEGSEYVLQPDTNTQNDHRLLFKSSAVIGHLVAIATIIPFYRCINQ